MPTELNEEFVRLGKAAVFIHSPGLSISIYSGTSLGVL